MPPTAARRVLVAARDISLRADLARALRGAGYAIELADGPKHARDVLERREVTLAIVEPRGFGNAGLELARESSRAVDHLIIIAGGARELEHLRKAGLRADAYLAYRGESEPILARVAALLGHSETERPPVAHPRMLTFEGYTLDLAGRSLRDPSGREVALTANQFLLLATLASRPGQVLSRDQICEAIAGREATAYDRSVDVLISRLRRKIEFDHRAPRLIVTVPGVGYKFAVQIGEAGETRSASESIGQVAQSATSSRSAIGVAPFESIGVDEHCAAFARGLADELVGRLLQRGLIVCGVRLGAAPSAADLRRAAHEHRVHHLVVGSIRARGGAMRIAAHLIEGETGSHLWAGRHDLAMDESFATQEATAEKIALGITGVLSAAWADRAWPRDVERRELTIMACEFVGMARLATAREPEELQELTAAAHRCCSGIVSRLAGTVASFSGDGMLAFFGYPEAHEHDPEQAIRAALTLREDVGRLDAALAGIRVGIATGPVVIGDLAGAGQSEKGAVIGQARNLAAALRRVAGPNAVVIAESTRRLVGDLFECRELQRLDVEDFEQPAAAWEVVRASPATSRFDALRGSSLTPLVGREEELELLLRHWRQAGNGALRMVLLSGEPGIGKSRVVAVSQERLRSQPHICFRYACSPHHQDSALYPVIREIEGAAGIESHDTPEAKLAKLSSLDGLARLSEQDFALLCDMLGLPGQPGFDPLQLTARVKRDMTLTALVRRLEEAARRLPVLVIFEDAHWADPTSRELLDLVIERLAARPVLLLVTFRPDFAAPWIGKARVTTLTLNRLTPEESANLIRRVAGDQCLPNDLVDEIVERADGIPLFLEELSKSVLEADRDAAGTASEASNRSALLLPSTLNASVMARFDRLDPTTKEVAQIGAAIGREFRHELLAAVADRPDGEIAGALEWLTGSGLVFSRGMPPDSTFTFNHALVRDAAYMMVPRCRLRQLHGRIATELQQRFPDLAARLPAVVAHHFTEAGLTAQAVAYWGKAGRTSLAASAMVEAAAQLRKGLALLATLADNADRCRQELELQSALGSALLASEGHGAPEVGEVYARARALGEQLGDFDALVPILGGLFSYHLQRSEYAAGRRIAEGLLALAAQQNDATSRVVGHRAMGVCLHQVGDFASAATHFEQVVELYLPDVHRSIATVAGFDLRAAALRYLAFGEFIRGHRGQAMSHMADMMRWSRSLGHPYIMVHALNWTASFHLLRGDAPAALEPLEELFALADPKFPLWLALGQINRALLLAAGGNASEGLTLGRAGFAAMLAIGSTWNQTYYRGLLARICEAAGRPDEALEELQVALSIADRTGERWYEPELRRMTGELFVRDGPSLLAAGEDQFQRAIALAREQGARTWELRAMTSLGRLWSDQGRDAEAEAALAPISGWFTDGLDLPDMKAARALLARVARHDRTGSRASMRGEGVASDAER